MINIDELGNMTCYQGDSGTLTVNGLNTDQNYKVYFAVRDEQRNTFGEEIYVDSDGASSVTIEIPASLTDLWKVKKGQDYATYYYGLKTCDELGHEDTLMIAGSTYGDRATITVYPKKVEGIE